jgi:lysozyme
MNMNRKPIFDAVRRIMGRGLYDAEVKRLDTAIDEAEGVIVVTAPRAPRSGDSAPRAPRRINKAGLDLIKQFEGLRLKAYRCPADVWTIGYGSTGAHVTPGLVITEARAEELLQEDLQRFEVAVAQAAGSATDNQFAAMVSLAFNVGEAAFAKSTLCRKHNAADYFGAADEFKRWDKAAGRVMAGLSRRRAAEAQIYRTP